MNQPSNEHSLSLMNTAVVLVILIPLLLLMWEQSQQARTPDHRRPESQAQQTGTHDQPPIITISDTEVYSFPSGKAELSPDFERLLSATIIPKLAKLAGDY